MLEGHNQVFQLPHQDTVQIVGSVADAVVCQTVLREVVCAYLFFTAAGAGWAEAVSRPTRYSGSTLSYGFFFDSMVICPS